MVIQGKGKAPKAPNQNRPSPVSRIGKIASLKKFADSAVALDLMHDLAKAVAPIINDRRFLVGLLSEMDPKNANLLGLNVNYGQKILIRLRPAYNKATFLPTSDLIGTFLHELCHNVHGPHNGAFYALLKSLKNQFMAASYLKQYFVEETRLGGNSVFLGSQSIRDARIKKLDAGIHKAEIRRLGGVAKPLNERRRIMLEAAERRQKDNRWCLQGSTLDVPSSTELNIEVVDLTGEENEPDLEIARRPKTSEDYTVDKRETKIEVVDLTDD